LNEHAAVRTLSVALQVTVVTPSGNEVPDGGAHVTVMGGVPPVAVGAGNVTIAVGVPMLPSLMSAGHVSAISLAGVGWVVGVVGLPQAAHNGNSEAAARRRILSLTATQLS
jgi:hypothetical protein